MNWNECLNELKVKRKAKDVDLARSALNMSQRWIKTINYIPNNEITAPIIASSIYEALLEICSAILSLNGYKSYSHKCITYFLKEILKEEKSSVIFDRNRRLRNGINYYGINISPERSKNALVEIKKEIEYLSFKYLEDIMELSEETKKNIEISRQEIKNGKTISLEEVEKKITQQQP